MLAGSGAQGKAGVEHWEPVSLPGELAHLLHLLFGRILYISNIFNFPVGSEVESEPRGQVLADSLGVSVS